MILNVTKFQITLNTLLNEDIKLTFEQSKDEKELKFKLVSIDADSLDHNKYFYINDVLISQELLEINIILNPFTGNSFDLDVLKGCVFYRFGYEVRRVKMFNGQSIKSTLQDAIDQLMLDFHTFDFPECDSFSIVNYLLNLHNKIIYNQSVITTEQSRLNKMMKLIVNNLESDKTNLDTDNIKFVMHPCENVYKKFIEFVKEYRLKCKVNFTHTIERKIKLSDLYENISDKDSDTDIYFVIFYINNDISYIMLAIPVKDVPLGFDFEFYPQEQILHI